MVGEVEKTMWTIEGVGVLAALVTTATIAEAGAAAAVAIGIGARCIPRAGTLQDQASLSRRRMGTESVTLFTDGARTQIYDHEK